MYKVLSVVIFLINCGGFIEEGPLPCIGPEFNNQLIFNAIKEMSDCSWLTPPEVKDVVVDVNEYPYIQECGEHHLKTEELYFLGCHHIIEPTLYTSIDEYDLTIMWKVYCDGMECLSWFSS